MGQKNQYVMTNHANVRVPQRGIKREEVEMALDYGHNERTKNGCLLRYIPRRKRKELWEHGIGVQLGLNICLVVGRHGEIITAYHLPA